MEPERRRRRSTSSTCDRARLDRRATGSRRRMPTSSAFDGGRLSGRRRGGVVTSPRPLIIPPGRPETYRGGARDVIASSKRLPTTRTDVSHRGGRAWPIVVGRPGVATSVADILDMRCGATRFYRRRGGARNVTVSAYFYFRDGRIYPSRKRVGCTRRRNADSRHHQPAAERPFIDWRRGCARDVIIDLLRPLPGELEQSRRVRAAADTIAALHPPQPPRERPAVT